MLAWIGSIFKRSNSSIDLDKKEVPKNDEDWMVVDTNLKSFSEQEHNKSNKPNNANKKTSLYSFNNQGKKNKTATTMTAIGLGQNQRNTDNDLSLLKDKIGMAGINLTGFTNIPLNGKLKDNSNNDNVNNILLTMKDREQKMKKDKKLKKRNNKA
ncbi:hypothetical protein BCR32DRAFT_330301 [Anaeromyces robustus]|uniref:Uncharacterized protein n=1 Tax=Anaeromyces robustus TaxID=1754192 RepID=A0A1Y1VXL2_9FUNG|nr:hypothetical protein BCR32DRAFT_330301 [Anaeromyces robustus]|eukprot:ORX65997.1 hypothetical protein BCR32DRAFT_330301 [Anaeromyces robustus]